jgi:adenylosuccinate lyase
MRFFRVLSLLQLGGTHLLPFFFIRGRHSTPFSLSRRGERNMNVYGGVIFSQRVLLTLVSKGISRESAYKIVQENAHRAWNTDNGNFKAFISQDERVTAILSPDEIESCFDPQQHLNHLNSIYQRLDI